MMKRISAVICGLLLVLATSCAPSQSTPSPTVQRECSQLRQDALRNLPFRQAKAEDVLAKVLQTHHLRADQVVQHRAANGAIVNLQWVENSQHFVAEFRNDTLYHIRVSWDAQQPTANEILRCLGAPQLYEAEYVRAPDARALKFSLFYPEQGWIAYVSQASNEPEPPAVSGQTQIPVLLILPAVFPPRR